MPRPVLWLLSAVLGLARSQGDGPIVARVNEGLLRGTRRSHDFGIPNAVTHTVDEFLRIPFAKPPIGNKRFHPPVPPDPWSDIRFATYLSPACPQDALFDRTANRLQDEDCLYLNIYAPYESDNPSRRYPVMVYIHGGSYLYGTGNRYNGTALAQSGVVLVAINYRLGVLGFLTTGDARLVGNYGLMDQMQALQWLQQNVASFRGDPNRVTIFGSSAGGASVGLLMFAEAARGLFHYAIAESGTANAMWATHEGIDYHRHHMRTLAVGLGCDVVNDDTVIECLTRTNWTLFRMSHVCKLMTYICSEVDPLFKPVIDGTLLRYTPDDYLTQLPFPPIPYMTGTVRTEFGSHFSESYSQSDLSKEVDRALWQRYGSVPEIQHAIEFQYVNWSRQHGPRLTDGQTTMHDYYNRAKVLSDLGLTAPTAEMAGRLALRPEHPIYLYYFSSDISYHSVELNYVFGLPFVPGSVDEMLAITQFNESDRVISSLFMNLWTSFATDGVPTDPSDKFNFTWQRVRPNHMDYLHIDHSEADMRTHLRGREVALWNTLIPTLIETYHRGLQDASPSTAAQPQVWVLLGLCVALFILSTVLVGIILHGNSKTKQHKLIRNTSSNSYPVNL